MPDYRRAFVSGGTFFLTVVTHGRRPVLGTADAVATLRHAIATVQRDRPFAFDAGVVLPDHTHWMWTMAPGDADFSSRVGQIKALFTKSLDPRPDAVWQPRFWEHVVRDVADRNRLLDYIHFNPVKHGYDLPTRLALQQLSPVCPQRVLRHAMVLLLRRQTRRPAQR